MVSYSGGKDSLVVMDMCVRTFPKVEAFMMEFVPGLPMNQERIDYAKSKWGVSVKRYPDPGAIEAIKWGIYCDSHWKRGEGKGITLPAIQRLVCKDFGIPLIATGHKRSDSIGRRSQLEHAWSENIITPLIGFRKADVISYLRAKGIPLPVDEGRNSNAIGLNVQFLLWCHDNHPEDWKRLCAVFPYVACVPWRRTFYESGTQQRKETPLARAQA